ncbi:MAG: ESPR-type extended signal peptide-containing protein, partial [Caecibacter massiliensis]|nr:ESPR-type extended signal peptide-containing protein [Caecibacter massiliensis]
MNKIFKVIYSKTKHCYVVVSELAKSHCKSTQCNTAKSKTALTAAILLVLGTSTFTAVPTVQATDSLFSNDYVGTNYKKDDGSSYSAKETKNYHGAGAEGVGSNTLGMNAIAGKNTITIGDRDASGATESVYIGAKYDANNQVHPSSGHNVVSVGYGSDAAGTGSIAIGSGAAADTFDNAGSGTNPDKASQSIAIGNNAQAKQNNIAIGAGSVATATASTADAYLTGQAAVSSYVSVGGGTVTTTDSKTQETTTTTTLRRITNVADGATASDVATVGQLQALSDKVGVYDAGFGIEIDSDKDNKTNTISLNRNLGKDYNTTDDVNLKNDAAGTSLILGGRVEKGSPTGGQSVTGDYGALGRDSVTVGGVDNTVETSGDAAVVVGGIYNKAAGTTSAVVGGSANDAIG